MVPFYRACYANLFPRVHFLWRLLELAPGRSPNKHSEHFVEIWFIKVDEGGFSLAAGRIMGADNLAAYGLFLAEEFGGLFRGDGILGVGND